MWVSYATTHTGCNLCKATSKINVHLPVWRSIRNIFRGNFPTLTLSCEGSVIRKLSISNSRALDGLADFVSLHFLFFRRVCAYAAIEAILWYQRGNANCRISTDFLFAVVFLLHKRAAFRLREHGYRDSAPGEIGNLSAGYGAGINLMQFISLSLSGLLILITTVRFTFRDSAYGRQPASRAGCAAQTANEKSRALHFVVFDNTVMRAVSIASISL